jgi:DHA1 family multidrug resistance protein-like MFS transporter
MNYFRIQVFPLVYPVMYGFNVGQTGIVFTCIIVGCIIAMAIYFSYLHFYVIPHVMKNGLSAQEWWLRPAMIACVGPVIGLFIFGTVLYLSFPIRHKIESCCWSGTPSLTCY